MEGGNTGPRRVLERSTARLRATVTQSLTTVTQSLTSRDVFSSIFVEVMLATCSGEMTKNTATRNALHRTEGDRAEKVDSLGSQFQMV
jgi:uncharacterized lipoprotein YajG